MTGLPHTRCSALAFIVAALVFGFGANLACSVVGFVCPDVQVLQAIELTGLGVHEIEGGATEKISSSSAC